MSNMITGVIQDGKIDILAIGAAAIGAYIGQKLPGWKGVSGKGFGGGKKCSWRIVAQLLKKWNYWGNFRRI